MAGAMEETKQVKADIEVLWKGSRIKKVSIDLTEVSNPCRPLWEEWSRQREGWDLDPEMCLAGLRKNKETNVAGML